MMRKIVFAGLLLILGVAVLPAQNASKKQESGKGRAGIMMKIKLTSVMVDDQSKALKFYTEILGFVKKRDMPAGKDRWLTLVSPTGPADIELLLEPMGFPPARTYQKALFEAGIPATMFAVEDVQKAYESMVKLGVAFRVRPTKTGAATIAVFEDTCGNLIQIFQE